MTLRSLLVGVGAAIATALVVAVTLTALLPFAFSALVGVPVGLLAGLLAGVASGLWFDRLASTARRLLLGIASFGYAAAFMLFVSYANLGGLRSAITSDLILAVAVGTLLVVYLVSGRRPVATAAD